MARHKRGHTNWRGGRGRSGLVSFKAWHITNKDSLTGEEEEGGAGWRAQKRGMLQMRMHQQGERKREESIHDLGNMAHHRGLTYWRARRERSTLVSSGNVAHCKQGLTC